MNVKYPGIPDVIHGNGAIAEVMGHVCGGVIGYPITPSTEISEIYEAFRSGGGCNVWGRHPFFFEPEGEHSAQSGALGAALTGGKYISNASSSQGILYGLESHYVTVGKKVGGFVLQVAARVVSKHSLNVMAGHDDVYALLQSGYTILFGSNPQEAADLAAISYKLSALSLIPVANAMDGFTTSHMLSEVADAGAGAPARISGRPVRPHQVPDGGAGDAVRRQGPRLPAAGLCGPSPERSRSHRPAGAQGLHRQERRRDREGRRRQADRQDARLAAGGDAGAVAPPVAQRPREGHPPAGAGAGRRAQSRPDRRRAEPARLPGRRGRPPHPFCQRGAALRPRDHGRIHRADRPRLRADQDLHGRGRRARDDRARLGHRRRRGGRHLSAQQGQEGRRHLGQAACSRSRRRRSSRR